jgi:hypothetical protein
VTPRNGTLSQRIAHLTDEKDRALYIDAYICGVLHVLGWLDVPEAARRKLEILAHTEGRDHA